MSTRKTKKPAANSMIVFDFIDAVYMTPKRELTVGILCAGGGATVMALGVTLIIDVVLKTKSACKS